MLLKAIIKIGTQREKKEEKLSDANNHAKK